MIVSSRRPARVSLLLAAWLLAAPLPAHQQKESVTRVLFNPRTGNIEVMHRFLLHDAEHATRKLFGGDADLLGNAADASDPEDAIRVRCEAQGGKVRIQVEDHGHGIPEELRAALFEPFVTSKPPGRGTGLGLALVYSIIEDHHGTVWVESPIHGDRGTRFIIELPRFSAGALSTH